MAIWGRSFYLILFNCNLLCFVYSSFPLAVMGEKFYSFFWSVRHYSRFNYFPSSSPVLLLLIVDFSLKL